MINFRGSSATETAYLFSDCTSLIYVNLYNFKINSPWIQDMFRRTQSYLKICVNDDHTRTTLSSEGPHILFDC